MPPSRGSRYPIWSARAFALLSIPVVAVISVLVFWISHSSPFVEFQITLLVIALVLFTFLTLGLYLGVRIERPHREALVYTPPARAERSARQREPSRQTPSSSGHGWAAVFDLFRGLDLGNIDLTPGDGGGGDDLLGCVGSILAWIALAIVATVVLWLLAQVLWATAVVLVAALYWVFYRALRVVFAHSRTCQRKLRLSAGYGLLYTVLYTGWMFALLWIGRLVLSR